MSPFGMEQVLAGISNSHCDNAAVISLRSSNSKKMRTNTYPLFSTANKFESVRYGIR